MGASLPVNMPGFECRLCSAGGYDQVLDLGSLPLPNALTQAEDQPGEYARTILVICRSCRLLQLQELVDRERLFSSYVWTSSSSASAVAYAASFASRLAADLPPATHPAVLEIASNDGLILRALQAHGYDVFGVEPSNLADEANAAGLPTFRGFFDAATAEEIARTRRADVIVARNVIGHTQDLAGFLAGLRTVLAPGGTVILESPYALALRVQVQYDTIFHEHISYFTITTLQEALGRHGMRIASVDMVAMNGGSFLCAATAGKERSADALRSVLSIEDQLRLNEPEGWRPFSDSVRHHRQLLRELLGRLRADGCSVWVYGAAAKTIVMLNYCQIDRSYVEAIADNSPRKQGMYVPGLGLLIRSPRDLLRRAPDYVVIGPSNLQDEIRQQLRGQGYAGRFVSTMPIPRLLGSPGQSQPTI
jgi:SAM-dependent methyltransferase